MLEETGRDWSERLKRPEPSPTSPIASEIAATTATTYVVSVGRALGMTSELSFETWTELRRLVYSAIEATGTAVVFDGHGVGLYEGAVEDSATVIAVGNLSPHALATLRRRLADVAECYGQESIALTIGATELIEPAAPYGPVSRMSESAPATTST